jgi:hypothetical protein
MMKKIYLSILSTIFFVCLNVDSAHALGPYFLKPGADLTIASSWGLNSNGTGAAPNFAIQNTYNFNNNNASITLSSTWGIAATSIVNFGDGSNAFTFILATGGQVGSGTAPKVIFNNLCTLILQQTATFGGSSSKTVFNTGSTVEYVAGSAAQIVNYSNAYYNLIISDSKSLFGDTDVDGDLTLNSTLDIAGAVLSVTGNVIQNAGSLLNISAFGFAFLSGNLSLTSANLDVQGGELDVTGDITIDNSSTLDVNNGLLNLTANLVLDGNLTFGGGTVTLNGSTTGTGAFTGDNQASLNLTGTGSLGTLDFSQNDTLNTLDVSLGNATSTFSLASDLKIKGGSISLNVGIMDINSFQLYAMSNSSVNFNGGAIGGDPSSSLILEGAISGTMLMDAVDNSLFYVLLSSPGNTLTLGNELHIEGLFNPRAGVLDAGTGFLVLKSTASSKGSIGMVQPAANIIGEIKVETFIPQSVTGWGQLGVSGVKNQTVGDWQDDIAVTCVGCTFDELSTGAYFVSVNAWEEATENYDTTTAVTDPLTPGKGFWVYLGDGPLTSNPLMLVNTGSVVTGNVTMTLTNAGPTPTLSGWNLVSNPYPSTIDWNKVLSITSNNQLGQDIYSWSASGGDESYVSGANTGAGFQNGLIAMGQGFYVEYIGTGLGTITFSESIKDTAFPPNNVSIMAKQAASTNWGKMFRLKLKGGNYDMDDEVIRIHPDATPLFDKGWDARKLFQSPGYSGYPGTYSQYTSISSKDPQGNNYSIHSVGVLTQSLSIPILVQAMYTGQYTITATEFEDIENCLLLKDKLTGTIHDLKSGPVIVTIADTTSTPRFELMMCGDASPVGISELKASSNIFINQDQNGAFVTTQFDTPTKATITAYNIVGQQLMAPITVDGTTNTTHLNLDVHSQVVLIKVTTNNESVVKKIITH